MSDQQLYAALLYYDAARLNAVFIYLPAVRNPPFPPWVHESDPSSQRAPALEGDPALAT